MEAVVPKSASELFDVLVPQWLARFPDKAKEVNAIYALKISGDGGGDWTMDLTGTPPTCAKGDSGTAQCTFIIEHEDFKKMLQDPNQIMEMYFNQKLQVTGDLMLSMRLKEVLENLMNQPA